jgi:prepilin-type N-terminal cleavage/methylation domain-containing protein
MKIQSGLKNSGGFTLLEVMVAIVILSIALISLSGLLTRSMRSTTFGRNTTIADNLAREMLEEIKRQSISQFNVFPKPAPCTGADPQIIDCVAASNPLTGANPDRAENYGTIAGYPTFRREVFVTDDIVPPNTTIKDVAVRVIWRDGTGSAHPTLLRTSLVN